MRFRLHPFFGDRFSMRHAAVRHVSSWLETFTLPAWVTAWLPGLRSRTLRRLLTVETDGFRIRAAIVRSEQDRLSVERVAHSSAPTLAAALDEMLPALRQTPGGLPTSAILLMPGVIPALLELPVNPEHPRPDAQMQELMRWELDPLFAQLASVWTLETVLVGRGYLTYSQVEDLTKDIERRKHAQLPAIRLGDLALERKMITRQQLDECRSILEWLQTTDDDIVCGWIPQPGTGVLDADTYLWLACGVGRSQRARCVELFARRGLELTALYPLMGCGSAMIHGPAVSDDCGVVEARTGQLLVERLVHGGVREFHLHYTDGHPPAPKSVGQWVPPDIPTLWVAGHDVEMALVTDAIRTGLGRTVQPLPVDATPLPPTVSPSSMASILGASRHAFQLPGKERVVAVPTREPGPPLWQRVETWALAIGLLAVTLIAGLEMSFGMKKQALQEQHAALSEKLRILQSEIARINERIADLSEVEKAIEAKKAELERAKQRLHLLEVRIPQREAFLSGLLDAIAGAVTSEVVIDQIIESERGPITINGWALTEKAAQQFAQALSIAIDQWDRKVVDFKVWEREGRLGLPGFALSLQLISSAGPEQGTL
ncbi:MAG: hypothetical protein D6690_02475 [Nitrospirae bacterium]|nr:MAG: hypothetical protein D6690_02475 [Nitrospirota bacterium]